MIWAYVFISSRQPKNVLRKVRKIPSVLHADALFGSPDIIAVVAGGNLSELDAVIDRIAEIPEIVATDSKVARPLDGVEFPIKPRMRRA
jgi:DNA-binding Lrp family transcriptional regulator